MALWFFQLSEREYPLTTYRLHIWENERWRFLVRKMVGAESPPVPGDVVVFFYAPTGAVEFGIVGWAIVLQWVEGADNREVCFRPTAPSDFLKMHPWNDEEAIGIADAIRGAVKQGTLWPIPDEPAKALRQGISAWLSGHVSSH